MATTIAAAQSRVVVTVNDLIRHDRQLEVSAGTEIVWHDEHFERVWFPPGEEMPRVDRTPDGFRTVFERPGAYRGLFTIRHGHTSGDVYQMTVTVR